MHKAVLDSSAGFVVAYKACAWAQYLARKAGVEFILHPTKGRVVSIDTADSHKTLVRTADGTTHEGDLVVVAGTNPAPLDSSFLYIPTDHFATACRWRLDGRATARSRRAHRDNSRLCRGDSATKGPARSLESLLPRELPRRDVGNARGQGYLQLSTGREWGDQDRLQENQVDQLRRCCWEKDIGP